MPILTTKNLNKKYGQGETEVNALLDISISIENGEFVSIMGASGSGKSTLLHLLGGLDKPTSGIIELDDIQLSDLTEKKITLLRRKKIGFIFQFFNLMPTLTAKENIALPFLIDKQAPKNYKNEVDDVLKIVGLTHRKNHKPDELSGGEQQRIAVARALVTKPSIILADEPTGNLDSKNSKEILNLLRKSCDEFKQTIIMVTHDPIAASYSDKVIFLKDGAIIDRLKIVKEATSDGQIIINSEPVIIKLRELNI